MDVIKIYKNQRIFRMNEIAVNIKNYIDKYVQAKTQTYLSNQTSNCTYLLLLLKGYITYVYLDKTFGKRRLTF